MTPSDPSPLPHMSSERRICPYCSHPLWEDATDDERRMDPPHTCSPLRCDAWKVVGKATGRDAMGHRRMLRVIEGEGHDDA